MNPKKELPLDLSIQLARKQVEAYSAQDELMAQHHEAMKCRDCEEFLAMGIAAHNRLRQTEETAQDAAKEGIEVSPDVMAAVKVLYRSWLRPCVHAEQRILELERAGYQVNNLADFRGACEDAKKRVQAFEMYDAIDDAFEGRIFDEEFVRKAEEMGSGTNLQALHGHGNRLAAADAQ
jgi:hypothetical protein